MAVRGSNRSIEQRPCFDLRPRRAEPALTPSLFLFDGHCSPCGHQARRWARLPQTMRRRRVRLTARLGHPRVQGIKLRHRYGRNALKIGIVGAGQVGATAAYSMMMRRVGSRCSACRSQRGSGGRTGARHSGRHAFADPVRVRAGEFADLDGARLVVLAAGANQRPGSAGWICYRATPKSSQRSCRQCWRRRRT